MLMFNVDEEGSLLFVYLWTGFFREIILRDLAWDRNVSPTLRFDHFLIIPRKLKTVLFRVMIIYLS